MKRILLIATLVLLGGCATGSKAPNVLFDFGPLPAQPPATPAAALPALVVTDVTGPADS